MGQVSGVLAQKGMSKLKGRERTRMQVRIRDGFSCQDCGVIRTPEIIKCHNGNIKGLRGKIKHLDVHHIDGMCGKNSRGYDKVENMEGLTTLCHRCHYNRPEHKMAQKSVETRLRREAKDREPNPKIDELVEYGMDIRDIASNLRIPVSKIKKYLNI